MCVTEMKRTTHILLSFQVRWGVYSYYLKSVGITLSIATIIMNILYQVFSIGANFWLNSWTIENEATNTTGDIEKRDMYLGVYGAFGIGQGKLI